MNHATRKGFTIVEIAIVIAIISVLLTITMVVFSTVQAQSRDSDRRADTVAIKTALDRYFVANGEYPNICPGGPNSGCSVSYLVTPLAPYTTNLPITDATGNAYNYVRAPAYDSYALRIPLEASPICKTGIKVDAAWWGTGVPTCSNL